MNASVFLGCDEIMRSKHGLESYFEWKSWTDRDLDRGLDRGTALATPSCCSKEMFR